MSRDQAEAGQYDVIIVGAGAAGCVLASRLSELPGKRVLLIEAGPDAPPGREHPDIRDPFPVSYGNASFFWQGLVAEVGAEPADGGSRSSEPYLQGFGVGGGSNVNGMAADRGQPSDYDEWRDLGAAGWGWTDVLPFFKKLEDDEDFTGHFHGKDGPIPIRRLRPELWAPFAKALAKVFTRRGASMVDDYNGEPRDGVSSVPMSCLADRRVSASMAYLTDEVRRRPNLTILANTKAKRLDVRNGRVYGVEVRTSSGVLTVPAVEVIVAGGAVHSPTLLLRSGIGPVDELQPLGIDAVRDLRGVGRNLQNHPAVTLGVHLPPGAVQPADQRAWQQNQLRYSSKLAGCSAHDMLLLPFNKGGWHPLGQCTAALVILVLKAYSKGHVELISGDDRVAPRVCFNLLDDERDFERLVGGLRLTLETLGDEEVMGVRNEVLTPNGAIAARLAKRSAWNWLQAWLISKAFCIGPLRRALLKREIVDVRSMARDENAIRNYVRRNSRAVYHVCGTCRMGDAGDPEAVVDSSCRVLGIAGLRVVDASVFPAIPSGNTHIPVLMVAEKIADRIKVEWLDQVPCEVRVDQGMDRHLLVEPVGTKVAQETVP